MKSYSIIYEGDIANALNQIGANQYIILNESLAVLYVDNNFDEKSLAGINEVAWFQEAKTMSTLIEVGDNPLGGESVINASGVDFVENNPYINVRGENIIIGILDSGIDYLHPDFINDDNTSKIISIWDQNNGEYSTSNNLLFGKEIKRDEINQAIANNDSSLTVDTQGTGTIAAGISAGNGRLNPLYRGVAMDSELIVVKLKEYEGTFQDGKINYLNTDFLAGIKYILDVAKNTDKFLIINLTVGEGSRSQLITNLIETFEEVVNVGAIVVCGAGNEGNTDIHYEGFFSEDLSPRDVILEVGDQKNLDITIAPDGPGIYGVEVISPSGEISYKVEYFPDAELYKGRFNLEDSDYEIRLIYPWLLSGNEEGLIRISDIKPGIWTLRIFPEFLTTGQFDIYLPNRNLISENTRFLDSNSYSTITLYGVTENIITVGAYNDRTNSMWIGSSKGPIRSKTNINPDIVAPGVDIISPFLNNSYIKSTGTGVSSSLTSGVIALLMEYLNKQTSFTKKILSTEVLKTYLMLGATKNSIYTFPNASQGYGVLNLQRTIEFIANSL